MTNNNAHTHPTIPSGTMRSEFCPPALRPHPASSSRTSTPEGTEFFFSTVGTTAPALQALLSPLVGLKSSWAFCYRGPSVRHSTSLLGRVIWSRCWTLGYTDRAFMESIPDLTLKIDRPHRYRLALSSSALGVDHEIMRSRDPAGLALLATVLNDTIREVRANQAGV